MAGYDYPICKGKIIVLLGNPEKTEMFRDWYLHEHVPRMTAQSGVLGYIANVVVPSPAWEVTAKSNGGDPYGVAAIDEVKGLPWNELEALYTDRLLLGVYSATEYIVRELNTDRPYGGKSPEIKRIALLTKASDKTHAEAMDYWLRYHPDICLRHHTGMAFYGQNHIDEILAAGSISLDGFPMISYWNTDALRYGHFSRKDSEEKMLADCRNFRSTSYVLTTEEFIMKA